jgi:hypothetical protein
MRSPSFRHSTEVQTVLFDVSAFTPATAKAWARSHGFRAPAGDVTARYIRLRQRDPAAYRAGTFRTITLTDGVLAVVGVPKTGGNLKPRKNTSRYEKVRALAERGGTEHERATAARILATMPSPAQEARAAVDAARAKEARAAENIGSVLRSLGKGDKVTIVFAARSSTSPDDTRTVTVTGVAMLSTLHVYVTSGRTRPGSFSGGVISDWGDGRYLYQPTMQQEVRLVRSLQKVGGASLTNPHKNAGSGTGHGRTPYLIDFSTGKRVRVATPAEHKASQKQTERDGIGIIVIDGREYITETDTFQNPRRNAGGSTRPTRTAQVTAYLAAHGFPGLKLHKGAGYLYVSGGGSETWPETSVMTYRVSDQTLDQWLSDVRRLAGGARRNTGAGAHYEEARTAIRRAIAARGAPDYDARYVEAAHALNQAERHREQTPTFLAPRGSVVTPPMATHRPWRRNPAAKPEALEGYLRMLVQNATATIRDYTSGRYPEYARSQKAALMEELLSIVRVRKEQKGIDPTYATPKVTIPGFRVSLVSGGMTVAELREIRRYIQPIAL